MSFRTTNENFVKTLRCPLFNLRAFSVPVSQLNIKQTFCVFNVRRAQVVFSGLISWSKLLSIQRLSCSVSCAKHWTALISSYWISRARQNLSNWYSADGREIACQSTELNPQEGVGPNEEHFLCIYSLGQKSVQFLRQMSFNWRKSWVKSQEWLSALETVFELMLFFGKRVDQKGARWNTQKRPGKSHSPNRGLNTRAKRGRHET